MSLESCIRKAGKALTKDDTAAIRAIRDDMAKNPKNEGLDIDQMAVDEYIDVLNMERDFIMRQVEGAGGFLADPNLSPSEFSKRAAANLDKAARTFPQKGIMERPPAETAPVDYKSGIRISEGMYEANRRGGAKDRFERELLTERTHKTVEMLYPDFYNLNTRQVLNIVATFDPKAAMGLAKHFRVVPKNARTLTNMREVDAAEREELHEWSAATIAEWIEKNETLPLYYKVDDIFERDMAENNPEHPLSVASKYAQVMEEADSAPPVGIRKMMNWMRDKMGIAGSLGAVPQSKLKDFVRYGMESVAQYTATVKRMDAWMNQEMEGHHFLAKKWLTFNRSNKEGAKMLGEFMHASTLTGVDVPAFEMPDAATMKKMNKEKRAMWQERAANYKRLAPFWKKLGGMGEKVTYQQTIFDAAKRKNVPIGMPMEVSEAQMIYLSVRDLYASNRGMLMKALEDRIQETEADQAAKAALIAKLRKQFEAGRITPYFPLSRFGKYAAVAKTKDGEIVGYIKRENSRDRNRWMQEMRKKGFIVVPFEDQVTDVATMNKIDPGFVASVTDLLGDSAVITEDPKTGEPITTPGSAIQDEIWQMYLRSLPDLSARKHYIHRVGRLGFTHDALRSFSDHMFHGTHQMAKLRYGHLMSEHLKNIEEESVIVMQRAAHMQNMIENDWRPEGFEDATIHQVLYDTTIGGPNYRAVYSKFRNKGMSEDEASQATIDKMLKESEHDGPWAVPLSNEMKRRHEYNMNPKSAPWSTKLTALGFFWFLSTSPAAGVLNLTQTAISAYPVLRARFKGAGAGQELLKASKEFIVQPWLGLDKQGVQRMTAKLRNDKDSSGKEIPGIGEKAAMEEFWDIGIFSKTRTRELMGLSEAGMAYSHRQEQYMEMAGYIFHKTEEMNRAVTALAAYRLARKNLAGRKDLSTQTQHIMAVEIAEELVEMSHYDYTNTNRPRFMQGDKGRVVFLFRNYSLNMQYRLIRDFRDGIWRNKNIPIEARKEARSRFLGIIGMTTIFAGVSGYPLFWAVEAMANNLLGDDDDPFDSKTAMRKLVHDATEEYIAEGWGPDIATAVMKGPWSAFTGADLSQRASLNNLWIREVPESLKNDPRGLLLHLAGEAAGPIFGIGMNFATGFHDIQQGHADRSIERFTPKFVGDALKTVRYATQGAQTYQRDMVMSPEEFTTPNLALQFMGFTPTPLADRYEQNRAIKDMEMRLRNRRSDLMNQLFMAWRLGDRQTAGEVMQSIAQWNKVNPRYPISPEGIMQSARSRAQYDMRTVGGVSVDKRLNYLHNELRFTRRPGE
jgi:hypothetical protein